MRDVLLEEIDLELLTESLRLRLGSTIEASYLDGRTVLRNLVAEQLECSDELAEDLVETLEARGFVRFPLLRDRTHPIGPLAWTIGVRVRR